MHAGIQWQCNLCGQIYARRSIPHGCRAREHDFELINNESGAKGAEARKHLETFINERMHKHWIFVPANTETGDSTPQYQVRSEVKKIEKGREPNVNDKRIKKTKRK